MREQLKVYILSILLLCKSLVLVLEKNVELYHNLRTSNSDSNIFIFRTIKYQLMKEYMLSTII